MAKDINKDVKQVLLFKNGKKEFDSMVKYIRTLIIKTPSLVNSGELNIEYSEKPNEYEEKVVEILFNKKYSIKKYSNKEYNIIDNDIKTGFENELYNRIKNKEEFEEKKQKFKDELKINVLRNNVYRKYIGLPPYNTPRSEYKMFEIKGLITIAEEKLKLKDNIFYKIKDVYKYIKKTDYDNNIYDKKPIIDDSKYYINCYDLYDNDLNSENDLINTKYYVSNELKKNIDTISEKHEYLKYIENPLINIEKIKNFSIIPNHNIDHFDYEDFSIDLFNETYAESLEIFNINYYNRFLLDNFDNYEDVVITMLISSTILGYINKSLKRFYNRDYNKFEINNFFISYNLKNFIELDEKIDPHIKKTLLDNLEYLIKHKGTKKCLSRIMEIVGRDKIQLKKLKLIKQYNQINDKNQYNFKKLYKDNVDLIFEENNYLKDIDKKYDSLTYKYDELTKNDEYWGKNIETAIKNTNFHMADSKYLLINRTVLLEDKCDKYNTILRVIYLLFFKNDNSNPVLNLTDDVKEFINEYKDFGKKFFIVNTIKLLFLDKILDEYDNIDSIFSNIRDYGKNELNKKLYEKLKKIMEFNENDKVSLQYHIYRNKEIDDKDDSIIKKNISNILYEFIEKESGKNIKEENISFDNNFLSLKNIHKYEDLVDIYYNNELNKNDRNNKKINNKEEKIKLEEKIKNLLLDESNRDLNNKELDKINIIENENKSLSVLSYFYNLNKNKRIYNKIKSYTYNGIYKNINIWKNLLDKLLIKFDFIKDIENVLLKPDDNNNKKTYKTLYDYLNKGSNKETKHQDESSYNDSTTNLYFKENLTDIKTFIDLIRVDYTKSDTDKANHHLYLLEFRNRIKNNMNNCFKNFFYNIGKLLKLSINYRQLIDNIFDLKEETFQLDKNIKPILKEFVSIYEQFYKVNNIYKNPDNILFFTTLYIEKNKLSIVNNNFDKLTNMHSEAGAYLINKSANILNDCYNKPLIDLSNDLPGNKIIHVDTTKHEYIELFGSYPLNSFIINNNLIQKVFHQMRKELLLDETSSLFGKLKYDINTENEYYFSQLNKITNETNNITSYYDILRNNIYSKNKDSDPKLEYLEKNIEIYFKLIVYYRLLEKSIYKLKDDDNAKDNTNKMFERTYNLPIYFIYEYDQPLDSLKIVNNEYDYINNRYKEQKLFITPDKEKN